MKKRQQPEIRPTVGRVNHNRTAAAAAHRNSLTVNPNGPAGPNGQGVRHKKRKVLTRKKKIQIAAIVLGAFILLLAIGGYTIWRIMMNRININDPDLETLPSEYDLPTESLVNPLPSEKGIVNILLLGVDTRDADSIKERSDSMMILTIDQINNKIKLTSLQRDMLVYVPGKDNPVKINAANAYGGPLLAMRVVNDTFRLNIEKYMVVNMLGMEKLIDLAGGVTIEVDEKELSYLNHNLQEENDLYPDTAQAARVTEAGTQLLNGRQAVAYARIRKLDSDYKRMARQRIVLQALMTAFKSADLISKGNMISEGLSLITTNLSATQLTDIGLKILPLMDNEIGQMQIPVEGYFLEDSGASWVNRCDFNGMIPLLQQFIFGKTYPFDPVKEIPGAPNSSIAAPTSAPTRKPTAAPTVAPTVAPTTETAAPTTVETTPSTSATTTSTETDTTETTKHTGKPPETEPTGTESTTETIAPTTVSGS